MNDGKIKCAICGSEAFLKAENYPVYQEPTTFSIYNCKNCNTSFSLPVLDDIREMYENIYNNGREINGYKRYWIYADVVKTNNEPLDFLAETENTYWGIRKALNQIINNKHNSKIIEIGSGLGYLTYSLNKAGYNCHGIDLSEIAINFATENYGNYYTCIDLHKFVENKTESYDVVILTEVIEHIQDPILLLEGLLKIIKSNGCIILTSPNKSIYSDQSIWATDNSPVHFWWYSEDSILFLSNRLNLTTTFINFSEYYKKHFTYLIKIQPPNPATLDKSGKAIIRNNRFQKHSSFSRFKKWLLYKLPLLEKIYIRIKYLGDPNFTILSQRGTVICAILQKK